MIAYLEGEILKITENTLILLTKSWVWYEVHINESTYIWCVWKSEVHLYIYHHITEWAQNLFWCTNQDDIEVFKELIKISWVWGKVALNILNLWTEKLSQAILLEDQKIIESIKWIGKKMAEKIILELKDKDFIHQSWTPKSQKSWDHLSSLNTSQILETLTNMWYSRDAIQQAMQEIPEDMSSSMDEILPFLIKNL